METLKKTALLVGVILISGSLTMRPMPATAGFMDTLQSLGGLDGKRAEGHPLTSTEIGLGLKEALKVGSERVVDLLGVEDGFNGDPEVHIPLPSSLAKVQSVLKTVGMSQLADDVELKLNRAAEAAVPKAKGLFIDAITAMTLDDVTAIYQGPPDAATRYFQSKMSTPLADEMQPVVDGALSEVGAISAYDAMMGQYKSVPFVPDVKADLSSYVIDRALDGLFLFLAREEAAIREDPAKRSTELLRKVFGAT